MKAKLTITEALAELKTLDKRIESTREFVRKYGIRQGSTIDPLDDEGGSHVVIPSKLQSLDDLLQRKVAIRVAINGANSKTHVEIAGIKRTVAEWIIWRREAFPQQLAAVKELQQTVVNARKQCAEKGMTLKDDGTQPARVSEVACFIREGELQRKMDALSEIESTLDGRLSLVNATTVVEV